MRIPATQLIPLQEFPQARAAFEIHNSPLSENATVGFEFGYNVQEPRRLVIWEAQYGDFINGAQVMLDQFVTSGRAKWGLTPSLVFLLPHGYEGQGPEHSSARPERFLESAADINLRLVNCTTAAQYFHLLRRQAALLERDPLPLFVLTPKSLLRHPLVASTPRELEQGRFLSVIDDEDARRRASAHRARRALQWQGVCGSDRRATGALRRPTSPSAASSSSIRSRRSRSTSCWPLSVVRDVVWLQEEPENMGAWQFLRPLLEELIGDRCPLRYIGRARSSSPSEGSAAWHQLNQRKLVEQAFDLSSRRVRAIAGAVKEV